MLRFSPTGDMLAAACPTATCHILDFTKDNLPLLGRCSLIEDPKKKKKKKKKEEGNEEDADIQPKLYKPRSVQFDSLSRYIMIEFECDDAEQDETIDVFDQNRSHFCNVIALRLKRRFKRMAHSDYEKVLGTEEGHGRLVQDSGRGICKV